MRMHEDAQVISAEVDCKFMLQRVQLSLVPASEERSLSGDLGGCLIVGVSVAARYIQALQRVERAASPPF